MHARYQRKVLIIALALAWLALPAPGQCVVASFGLHPDKERLVFNFDRELGSYEVERTGRTTIDMTFSGIPEQAAGLENSPDLGGASIVAGISPIKGGIRIQTNNPAFGFLSLTLNRGRRVVIDLFADPLGARWEPPGGQAVAAAPKPRTAKAAPPRPADKPADKAEAPKEPEAAPAPPRTDTETGQSGRKLDEREAEAKVQIVRRAVEQAPPVVPRQSLASRWSPSGEGRGAYRGLVMPSEARSIVESKPGEGIDTSIPPGLAQSRALGVHVFRGSVIPPGEEGPLIEMPVRRFAADELPEPAPERPGLMTELAELAESGTGPTSGGPGEEQPVQTMEQYVLDLEQILLSAQVAVSNGEYEKAMKEIDILLAQPRVPKEMYEEAKYTKADILYQLYRDDLSGHFDEINGAYEAAMNYNLDSERVPSALLRRGILNLRVGNIPEAKAFFMVIRKNYPNDPNVPLTYYYWGDYYFNQGDYQEAADQFQYLVQVYPESKFIREASVSLARSLRHLGYDKQAFQIVDFIEKRWPRFYVEYPPFLKLSGDAAFHVQNWDKAKDEYWTYYNIDPKGDDSDIILARLGDIYVHTGKPNAAREIYEKAATTFPDSEGGLISKMRLAEEGIYDEPTIEQMFSIFDRPFNLRPEEIYKQIVDGHPDSALAPLAQLKTAMWHLYNNKYLDTLAAVSVFNDKFPYSDLKERSDEVGLKAFAGVVDQLISDENYPKVVNLWDEYDYVRNSWQKLAPETQLAVGLSFWKRGDPDQALKVISPLIRNEQEPVYSEMALSLALSIYADTRRWEDIKKLGELTKEWDLSPDYKRELRYAEALAHENLGELEKSREIWIGLSGNMDLDNEQRAYAIYFLAQRSLDNNDLKGAYEYARESLALLLEKSEDKGKIMDNLRILMDVTETSGRPREALEWAETYAKFVQPGETGWDALRYRTASLYKKAGDVDSWHKILEDLAKRSPNTLYGRMAASDLETHDLEQTASQYEPKHTLQ